LRQRRDHKWVFFRQSAFWCVRRRVRKTPRRFRPTGGRAVSTFLLLWAGAAHRLQAAVAVRFGLRFNNPADIGRTIQPQEVYFRMEILLLDKLIPFGLSRVIDHDIGRIAPANERNRLPPGGSGEHCTRRLQHLDSCRPQAQIVFHNYACQVLVHLILHSTNPALPGVLRHKQAEDPRSFPSAPYIPVLLPFPAQPLRSGDNVSVRSTRVRGLRCPKWK